MKCLINVIGYNRPAHLQKTLDALSNELLNRPASLECEVLVTIDGAKPTEPRSFNWESSVKIATDGPFKTKIEPFNRGLRDSIFSAIEHFLQSSFDVFILIEDDILVSRGTLSYFNEMFKRYQADPNILQVSAFSPVFSRKFSVFRYPRLSTWVWGTWKTKFPKVPEFKIDWENFDLDEWFLMHRSAITDMPDMLPMLNAQKNRKIQAWSLDLFIWMMSNNYSTIYPSQTMVVNIGHDGTGINCGNRRTGWFRPGLPDCTHVNWDRVGEDCGSRLPNQFTKYYAPDLFHRVLRVLYG